MKFGAWQLMFVVLMAGVVGASYMLVLQPSAQKRVQREAETAQKQKQLADLRQAAGGISDLARQIEDLEGAIRFFESKLPQEQEIDQILREVWQLAEANNLTTRTVRTLRAERSAGYSEQPIQMNLTGDFDGFYSFLLELEKLSRITRLHQMKLEKIHVRDGEMQAQLTLSIFYEADNRVAGR